MTLTWLDPANLDRRDVDGAVAVLEASRELEAPHEPQLTPNWLRANLNHGWDGDPPEAAVYRESGRVIAVLKTWMPKWDNRHFAEVNVTVDPECRRRGLGRELFEIGLRKVRDAGRTVVYSDCATGTAGEPFLEAMGLTKASEYANRGQDLLTLDLAQLEKGLAAAMSKADGYELVRMPDRVPDEFMDQVVRMTAAINDAPLDDLKMDDEVFSADRIRAFEAAHAAYGRRMYRLVAREKATGDFAGHTIVAVLADQPWHGRQYDTSVLRAHRGHRLGYALKAAMLLWLREEEPQLRQVYTWNAASNAHMIAVNEELGYRVVATGYGYQRDYAAQPQAE